MKNERKIWSGGDGGGYGGFVGGRERERESGREALRLGEGWSAIN